MTPIVPEPEQSPRYDGRNVLFSIMEDGRSVSCAISMIALQDLSTRRHFNPADLLRSFSVARDRIEAVALRKLRARSTPVPGLLRIWSDDLDAPLPEIAAPVVPTLS